ncbi:hypothetical protein AVEN_186420-1 [Araneus ventricosus]|uniref:ribonuclease H n=1 Tax=Araneus ventricosus TaxID=182803 RepID=A0A4Y2D0T6_ARAVE|nr:hypothetical protein AVEN_186420-1 [Araneus ventricosus]
MKRKLSSIQRPFLLHISGAYHTTPTVALQTILGIPPLHMQLQFEARFTTIYRLRIPLPPIITDIQPQDLEMKATGWSTHPSEHLKPNQISFEDGEEYIARKDILNIFTDGSKTEQGVVASFCVSPNDIWAYQWSAKLNDNITVFQAELTALHEAVIYASHLPNHNTSKIHVDNRASIMASSNSKSTKETARKIFKILFTNPRIKVSWVKAHAGNIGNERADQLAKDATQHGQPYSHTKLPKPHIKGLLQKRMLEEWQTSWKNGDTGWKIFNIMPSATEHLKLIKTDSSASVPGASAEKWTVEHTVLKCDEWQDIRDTYSSSIKELLQDSQSRKGRTLLELGKQFNISESEISKFLKTWVDQGGVAKVPKSERPRSTSRSFDRSVLCLSHANSRLTAVDIAFELCDPPNPKPSVRTISRRLQASVTEWKTPRQKTDDLYEESQCACGVGEGAQGLDQEKV